MKAHRIGFFLTLVLIFIELTFSQAQSTGVISGELKTWHRVTITFDGPSTSEQDATNPFTDYRLNVTFTNGGSTYLVPGFYAVDGDAAETSADAGNKWRVHFTPDQTGIWTYTASFRTGSGVAIDPDLNAGTATSFDGDTGQFTVAASDKTGDDFRAKGMLRYVGKHHLRFAESGEYWLKNGADSPENLLGYVDFDGTEDRGGIISDFLHEYTPHAGDWNPGDPSWQEGKGTELIGLLNYLASQSINSVYFLTYNLDGGDGQDTWMWTSHDERERFDVSKLAQWEIVFSHMDAKGIQLHVVTQEIENNNLLGGDSGLNDVRKLYYRELIARFAHHLAVNWNIGEENTNSLSEQLAFAEYIHDLDPYDHPIVIHTQYNQPAAMYDPIINANAPHYTATSIQGDGINYNDWAIEFREKSAAAGHKWVIYGDEQGPPVDKNMNNIDQIVRESMWGNLMGGGAGVEYYFGYQGDFGDMQSEDMRVAEPLWQRSTIAFDFFHEYLPFWKMTPDNTLVGGDAQVLAQTGEIYAVHFPDSVGVGVQLDLGSSSDTFDVEWFDPVSGGALQNGTITKISGPGNQTIGQPPTNIGAQWVALIRNDSTAVDPTPTATISTPTATMETPEPTLTSTPPPADTDIIINGGFERFAQIGKAPDDWKTKGFGKKDKVKCDKIKPDGTIKIFAHEGDCAFRFKGEPGKKAKLIQAYKDLNLSAGTNITLHAFISGKNVVTSAVKVIMKADYVSADSDKVVLTLPGTITTDYVEIKDGVTLSDTVTKVKVKLQYKGAGGKIYFDALRLVVDESAVLPGLRPLPVVTQAPTSQFPPGVER